MNLLEFTILYLACGAPFGVYCFFYPADGGRSAGKSPEKLLHCFLISLFWLPFAFRVLTGIITKRLHKADFAEKKFPDSSGSRDFLDFEEAIAQQLFNNRTNVSVFDFRETFQRYLGLSLALRVQITTRDCEPYEFFQIIDHENPDLASRCLNRRNRCRLREHQILARQDFLQIIARISKRFPDNDELARLTFEFGKTIDDPELLTGLAEIFEPGRQTRQNLVVMQEESEVWIPILPDQPVSPKKGLNLPAASVAAMMSKPD